MSSQHVQTGALLSRGFVHDECANGLNTNVGGDAGCSESCDDTAPSPFAPSLLPVESDTQQSNESHVESHDVSSDVVRDGMPEKHFSKESISHSLREDDRCASVGVKSRPVVLDLCAGSAPLSAAFATDGFTPIAVDYEGNRHQSWHHGIHLDLRLASSWEVLRRIVLVHDVFFVHIAPPRGTSSRARERPVSSTSWGPAPLRSTEYPWGLPSLSERDAHRVEQANILCRDVASFCRCLSIVMVWLGRWRIRDDHICGSWAPLLSF